MTIQPGNTKVAPNSIPYIQVDVFMCDLPIKETRYTANCSKNYSFFPATRSHTLFFINAKRCVWVLVRPKKVLAMLADKPYFWAVFTDLYQIHNPQFADGKLTASVTLDAGHAIFAGHFPGQPVLPGVCQLALVKEVLETHLQKKLLLKKADQVKFMAMVDPRRTPHLELTLQLTETEGIYTVQALLAAGGIVFLKSKARFADA